MEDATDMYKLAKLESPSLEEVSETWWWEIDLVIVIIWHPIMMSRDYMGDDNFVSNYLQNQVYFFFFLGGDSVCLVVYMVTCLLQIKI